MSDEGKLAYNTSSGSLIYKTSGGDAGKVAYKESPSPPTEYGDVILVVTLSPQFLEGTKLHDYQSYDTDWRLSIWQYQYSPTRVSIGTMTQTVQIPITPGVSTSVWGVVRPVGTPYDFPQSTPFTVYATAFQPSSGATFSSQVQGYLWEWYDEYWNYHYKSVREFSCTFPGNGQRLLTGMTMTIS